MFVRIVKMGFYEDKVDAFLENFEKVKQDIRNFPETVFLNCTATGTTLQCFLLIVIGKLKLTWKTIASLNYLLKSGLIPSSFSAKKPKPGVWIKL